MDGEPELPPDLSGAAGSRWLRCSIGYSSRRTNAGDCESSAGTTIVFLQYTASCRGAADLVLIGHVHTPLDAAESNPRLIVPGGWHGQSSYVKVDDSGAVLVVETDDALISR